MGVKFETDGKNVDLSALLDRFDNLPANLMTNALKAGVRAAATAVKKEAQTLAPKKTGKLAKSLSVKLRRTNSKAVIRFSVTAGKFYARFIEFGASPHLIELYSKRDKKVLASGKEIFGKEVNHTGVKPKPFMRPALDAKESEVIPIIAAKITERLDKLAKGKA